MNRTFALAVLILASVAAVGQSEAGCEWVTENHLHCSDTATGETRDVYLNKSPDLHRPVDLSDAALRRLCDGMTDRELTSAAFSEHFCQRLETSTKVAKEFQDKFCGTPYLTPSTCLGKAKEEYDLNVTTLEHYRTRLEKIKVTKTRELCTKGVFDKTYCSKFEADHLEAK